jgi:hypothetical protein
MKIAQSKSRWFQFQIHSICVISVHITQTHCSLSVLTVSRSFSISSFFFLDILEIIFPWRHTNFRLDVEKNYIETPRITGKATISAPIPVVTRTPGIQEFGDPEIRAQPEVWDSGCFLPVPRSDQGCCFPTNSYNTQNKCNSQEFWHIQDHRITRSQNHKISETAWVPGVLTQWGSQEQQDPVRDSKGQL